MARPSPLVKLRPSKVPEKLHALLTYAGFWGVADDRMRERLIGRAPPEVQKNLKQVVAQFGPTLESGWPGPRLRRSRARNMWRSARWSWPRTTFEGAGIQTK